MDYYAKSGAIKLSFIPSLLASSPATTQCGVFVFAPTFPMHCALPSCQVSQKSEKIEELI